MRIPTLAELAAQGLADVVERNKKGEAVVYRLKPEGQNAVYSAMKHNATLVKADEGLRKQLENAAVKNAKLIGGSK